MTSQSMDRFRVLELSREVDEAVDQLWAAGNLSLVLRLLLEDCRRLIDSQRSSPETDAEAVTLLDELCREGSVLGTPELERELSPPHRELLTRLASGRRRCIRRLRASDPRSRRARRLALVAAGLVLSALVFLLFRNAPTALASGTYSDDFPASQAIDGLSKTEWLLPQGHAGWLELAFNRPRNVREVRLHNAQNGHFLDRATKSFKVEAYSRSRVVATARGEFPPIEAHAGSVTVELAARDVTHVRITVDSFYGNGGGLAEVNVR